MFGVVTVVLTYHLAAGLAESGQRRRIGLLAAALAAGSCMQIAYSQEARAYSMMTALAAWVLVWLAVLLRDKGQDIYRMKGVLAIHGMPHKFVFQGVHMVFDGQPLESAPWALGAGELPENKMIFIGKNLDRESNLVRPVHLGLHDVDRSGC